MANIASARKRIRQTARRTERNTARTSRMRTFIKSVEQAIASGAKADAAAALRALEPELTRAVARGLVHRNMAARKVSRLSARIKAMEGPRA